MGIRELECSYLSQCPYILVHCGPVQVYWLVAAPPTPSQPAYHTSSSALATLPLTTLIPTAAGIFM